MRMVNDMDRYYNGVYNKASRPSWYKAERMDYCDNYSAMTKKNKNFIATLLISLIG